MIHVGVADEDGVQGGENSFGEMVHLAAVKEQGAPGGPDADQQQGIVEETGEKGRLQIAECYSHG